MWRKLPSRRRATIPIGWVRIRIEVFALAACTRCPAESDGSPSSRFGAVVIDRQFMWFWGCLPIAAIASFSR